MYNQISINCINRCKEVAIQENLKHHELCQLRLFGVVNIDHSKIGQYKRNPILILIIKKVLNNFRNKNDILKTLAQLLQIL